LKGQFVGVVFASGKGERMLPLTSGRMQKQVLEIFDSGNPLEKTSLGRLVHQLQSTGVNRIVVVGGVRFKSLQTWPGKVNSHINVPILLVQEPDVGNWNAHFSTVEKSLRAGETALIFPGDIVGKSELVTGAMKKAGGAGKPFARPVFSRTVPEEKRFGVFPKQMVACFVANKKGLRQVCKQKIGSWEHLRRFAAFPERALKGTLTRHSIVNLNTPVDVQRARKFVKHSTNIHRKA